MSEKRCSKCEVVKPITEFYSRGQCKVCVRAINREKQRELKKTPEGLAKYRARRNKHKTTSQGKINRAVHAKVKRAVERNCTDEQIAEIKSEGMINSQRKLSTIGRQRESGRISGPCDAWNDWLYECADDEWLDKFYLTNPNLKDIRTYKQSKYLSQSTQNILRYAMRRGVVSRTIEARCGFTVDQAIERFQSLFTEGMDWDHFNKGSIHIDHIKPQASFDLSKEGQFKECWALDNLQPLWAADNLSKRDKTMAQWLSETCTIGTVKNQAPSRVGHLALDVSRIYCNSQNHRPPAHG